MPQPAPPDAQQQGLSRATADGVPLDEHQVIVGSGVTHEVVLARATLLGGTFERTRFRRTFRNAAAEADYILFTNGAKAPLIGISAFELFAQLTQLNIHFHPAIRAFALCWIATSVIGMVVGVLLSDVVAARLATLAPRLVLRRVTRARLHEVGCCVILCSGTFMLIRNVFAPIARFDCHDLTPRNDGQVTLADVAGHHCDIIGFTDTFKILAYGVLAPQRIAALQVFLPPLFFFGVLVQVANVFGDEVQDFYDVSASEKAGRVIVLALEAVAVMLLFATVERTRRAHFVTVAHVAVTGMQRIRTNANLKALQSFVSPRAPLEAAAASTAAATRAASTTGSGTTDLTDLAAAGRQDSSSRPFDGAPSVQSGEAVVLWVNIDHHGSQRAPASALADHADALHEVLALVGHVEGVLSCGTDGNAIWASAPLRLLENPDADEAALQTDAVALCWFARELFAGARRLSDVHTTWRGVTMKGAVGVGPATQDARDASLDQSSPVYATLRGVVASPTAQPWSVLAVDEVMSFVQDVFTSPSYHNFADTRLFAVGEPHSGAARPAPAADGRHEPVMLVDVVSSDDGAVDVVTSTDEIDARGFCATRTTSACCGDVGCFVALVPRFADEAVERMFVDYDNAQVVPAIVTYSVMAMVSIFALFLLLVVSSSFSAATAAILIIAVVIDGLVLVVIARFVKVLTTAIRTVVVLCLSASVIGAAAVCVLLEPSSQAARDYFFLSVPIAFLTSFVAPEHRVLRLLVVLAVSTANVVLVTLHPPQGHEPETSGGWSGGFLTVGVAILVSRASRAQFADMQFLEEMRAFAAETEKDADQALRRVMPAAVCAHLRAAPAEPLHAAVTCPTAHVLYFTAEPAALQAHAKQFALSKDGTSPELLEAEAVAVFLRHVAKAIRRYSARDMTHPLRRELDDHRHVAIIGDGVLMVDFTAPLAETGQRDPPPRTPAAVRGTFLYRIAKEAAAVAAQLLLRYDPAPQPSVTEPPTSAAPTSATMDSARALNGSAEYAPAHDMYDTPAEALAAGETRARFTGKRDGALPLRIGLDVGLVCGTLAGITPRAFTVFGPAVDNARLLASQRAPVGCIAASSHVAGLPTTERPSHVRVGDCAALLYEIRWADVTRHRSTSMAGAPPSSSTA